MNCFLSTTKKAALKNAAFLLGITLLVLSAEAQNKNISNTFESTKKQATELLLQKKKTQAIQLVRAYEQKISNTASKIEAQELMVNISQKFLSRTTQEAYENSLNITVESLKDAVKSNEQCLSLDPNHLDCLIQKMRLYTREKNPKAARAVLSDIKAIAANTSYDVWLSLMADRRLPNFSSRQILKTLPENPQEDQFPLIILELERSFVAKNYSRARDLLGYLEKHFSDWPDLSFYQDKIDRESGEGSEVLSEQQTVQYSNKCKNLSKTIARKFRYDFDLCLRTNE
ncbi:hypothetical protein [Pseudobdellovibrio exovorus]|uniref:Uncharacterized protein n=1 Tax=Pseudobdellovibrio exovorus JSS TaxID=1184267 RepID=M4V8E5_9BACT|nr:hypothetical protein [Pseudobdellovibrio exovorus]AGH94276.1 hypothetical protein A11Q_56 [Pseudobdellovibrio exovorus JSS]